MLSKKNRYRVLCAEEASIPIFSRDWWLDATAGANNWDVALIENNGSVLASLPYTVRKQYGMTILGQPPLTQTLGPWLRQSTIKYAKKLSREKMLLHALIEELPVFDRYNQNWHHSHTNWLPFYWRGFNQATRYTYVLTNLSDEKHLWENLLANIRTDIRKAEKRYNLTVSSSASIDIFLELNKMVFTRQNKMPPYSENLVKRIDAACANRHCRKIFIAEDNHGRRHAGVYIIWDKNSAYYLMGGGDPVLRNSGSTSLCMWEAIKFSSTVTRQFDFEGSMVESIEKFFRAFGARQIPYMNINKTPSRLIRLKQGLQLINDANY